MSTESNRDEATRAAARDAAEKAAFRVGGVDRRLGPAEQLEQLVSYIDAHYPPPPFTPPWAGGDGDPRPADGWSARLPDRVTHAAMLMLGSGLDHSMPGVAWGRGVPFEDLPGGVRRFDPPEPTGRWAISLHSGGWWRGSGAALEHQWRPEVAAAAGLSGSVILDVDHPLAPEHDLPAMRDAVARAAGYARDHGARHLAIWGYSSGGALATLCADLADSLVLTFPDLDSVAKLPDGVRAGMTPPPAAEWPEALVQIAAADEIAAEPTGLAEAGVTVLRYMARHRVSTPEVARRRIRDVADFLRGGAASLAEAADDDAAAERGTAH